MEHGPLTKWDLGKDPPSELGPLSPPRVGARQDPARLHLVLRSLSPGPVETLPG